MIAANRDSNASCLTCSCSLAGGESVASEEASATLEDESAVCAAAWSAASEEAWADESAACEAAWAGAVLVENEGASVDELVGCSAAWADG